MKKNYEGLQIDVEYSIGEHNNNNQQVRRDNKFGHNSFGFPLFPICRRARLGSARVETVTITGGANTPDGKGNVEFYLGYTHIDPVKLSQVRLGLPVRSPPTTPTPCSNTAPARRTTPPGRLDPHQNRWSDGQRRADECASSERQWLRHPDAGAPGATMLPFALNAGVQLLRRSTTSSGRTSARRRANSRTMRSPRGSTSTRASCSWTTTPWRRSRLRAAFLPTD